MVIAGIEETKKRKNNIILEMKIYNTQINTNEIYEMSSLLHLNDTEI